jgi:hypothetical protein
VRSKAVFSAQRTILLCGSVTAENHRRLEQMEHALHCLEETIARLTIKRNALRQKELVKKIGVSLSGGQASLTGARADVKANDPCYG